MKPGPKPLPVKIRGRTYKSMKTAARALGVAESTVAWHLSQGNPDRVGIGKGRPHNGPNGRARPVTIGGISYKSLKEASDATGISYNKLKKLSMKAREMLK